MRLKNYLIITLALAMLVISCQDNSVITQPEVAGFPTLAFIPLPDGAEFQTATLNIYVKEMSDQPINFARYA